MKIVNYINNIIRLGLMKTKSKYVGSIVQGIPISTIIRSDTGTLIIDGKLSCRDNSYISAGTGELHFGANCFINQNVNIVSKERINIGKNVIIAPNVVIVDHDHNYKSQNQAHEFVTDPIVIGDDVWIGANAVIMKGTTVGSGSVVAAGTVLKGEYPANSLIFQEKSTKVRTIERHTKNE